MSAVAHAGRRGRPRWRWPGAAAADGGSGPRRVGRRRRGRRTLLDLGMLADDPATVQAAARADRLLAEELTGAITEAAEQERDLVLLARARQRHHRDEVAAVDVEQRLAGLPAKITELEARVVGARAARDMLPAAARGSSPRRRSCFARPGRSPICRRSWRRRSARRPPPPTGTRRPSTAGRRWSTRGSPGMAAELAAELADGDPCPVCGSGDHPQPALPTASAVTADGDPGGAGDREAHRDRAGRRHPAALETVRGGRRGRRDIRWHNGFRRRGRVCGVFGRAPAADRDRPQSRRAAGSAGGRRQGAVRTGPASGGPGDRPAGRDHGDRRAHRRDGQAGRAGCSRRAPAHPSVQARRTFLLGQGDRAGHDRDGLGRDGGGCRSRGPGGTRGRRPR